MAAGARGDEITLVAVYGLRPERDAIGQVSIVAHPDEFAASPALARPDRFAPDMEGGAAAGLRPVTSPAELLLLTHLALERGAG